MKPLDEAMRRAENAMTYREEYTRENLDAALASLAADGWVLVPREPTTEMFYAWVRNTPGGSEYVDGEPSFTSGWRAALAAAPKVVP